MSYYYTHKSKQHSALIREASCSRWKLTQKPTIKQCEGSESYMGVFSSNSSPQGSAICVAEEEERWLFQGNSIFHI